MSRFTVRKVLPMLWEIHDSGTFTTEWVLFGDRRGWCRAFAADGVLSEEPAARNEVLRELANAATRSGLQHAYNPPPSISPITWADDPRIQQNP